MVSLLSFVLNMYQWLYLLPIFNYYITLWGQIFLHISPISSISCTHFKLLQLHLLSGIVADVYRGPEIWILPLLTIAEQLKLWIKVIDIKCTESCYQRYLQEVGSIIPAGKNLDTNFQSYKHLKIEFYHEIADIPLTSALWMRHFN